MYKIWKLGDIPQYVTSRESKSDAVAIAASLSFTTPFTHIVTLSGSMEDIQLESEHSNATTESRQATV